MYMTLDVGEEKLQNASHRNLVFTSSIEKPKFKDVNAKRICQVKSLNKYI